MPAENKNRHKKQGAWRCGCSAESHADWFAVFGVPGVVCTVKQCGVLQLAGPPEPVPASWVSVEEAHLDVVAAIH